MTGDLLTRVGQHMLGQTPGFTSRYRVNRLVYYEVTPNIRAAIAREKEIKGWRRSRKIALIEGSNPGWLDLAVDWFGVR